MSETDRSHDEHPEAALVAVLAAGAKITDAAQIAGLSERTVRRRLADPGFKSQVDQLRSEMLNQAAGQLAQSVADAVSTLTTLLDAQSERVRVVAAKTLIELACKLHDDGDLERRVAELERLLEGETDDEAA